jgi:hypothetical protein
MTNRNDMTADQLREQATSLHASAGQAEQARLLLAGQGATAENAAEMWKLRTQSSMLRAQARELVALADWKDAEAETAATGLLVPMTRETGGTVEASDGDETVWVAVDDYGRGVIAAGSFDTFYAARDYLDGDDRFEVCRMTRQQYRDGERPWQADGMADVENPGQSAREALNLLRIGDTGGEPDQLAGEVLRYFAHLERQGGGMCDPASIDPDVAEAESADVDNPDDPDNDLDDLDEREAMRVELARTLDIDPRSAASVWGNLVDVVAERERERLALLR